MVRVVSILSVAAIGVTGCAVPGGASSAVGPPTVGCAQNGFYSCAGDFPRACLDTMAWAADFAVAYRAGVYPIGVKGELGSALDEVSADCGQQGLDAFIAEFPDLPQLVQTYGQ